MSKSASDDDARTVAAARAAVAFFVTIYVNREHKHASFPAKSLKHARAGGAILERRVGNGRQSMVYAVDAHGGGHFVPRHLDAAILAACEE